MSSVSHKSCLVDFSSRDHTLRIATWLVGRNVLRWVLIHDPQMNEVVSVDESWDEHSSRCLLNGEEGRNHDGKSSAEISGYRIGTIQREKAHPRLKTVDP